MSKTIDYEKRFWSRIDIGAPDECWEWQWGRTAAGYGAVRINYELHLTHRLAWELTNGPIPKGKHVCHKCDNPPCCNPRHLFLGDPVDNIRDANKKGRMARGQDFPHTTLSPEDVHEIHQLSREGMTAVEIAERFGVVHGTINAILWGENWKHLLPDDWEPPEDKSRGVHHPNSKLTPTDVRQIRQLADDGLSQRKIASRFDVSRGTVEAILKGITWKHVA